MGIGNLRLLGLPPLGDLAKASEVEDPIDRNVYRPIAYVIVGLLKNTSVTPNQITLASTLIGVAAGIAWIHGSRAAMVAGGILLLASSILDGADGMLARVKKIQSQLGRAVDGSADMVVALATVFPGVYHVWTQTHEVVYLAVILPVTFLTACSVYLYDYYKELFLRLATGRKGEGETLEGLAAQKAELVEKGAGLLDRMVIDNYSTMVRFQQMETGLTNPGVRELEKLEGSARTAAIYRKHNKGPMNLWAWISLTPHCYIMASLGIADRLHWYFWLRVVGMNALFVIALVWQRIATQRTLRELESGLPAVEQDQQRRESDERGE